MKSSTHHKTSRARNLALSLLLVTLFVIIFVLAAPLFPSVPSTLQSAPHIALQSEPLPHHLPLSVPDNITNRCFMHSHSRPCRPLLGFVKKRLRLGMLPIATQVAVSHEYKFIFIKTRKTAGSTLLNGFLRPTLCPIRPGDAAVHHWWRKVSKIPIRANCSPDIISPTIESLYESKSAKFPPPLSSIPWKTLEQYFIFAAVRNPYERAVSSYTYCELERFGTFEQFARNPGDFRGTCGGTTRHEDRRLPYTHWDPLVPELCDASGMNCAVDYIVDTANITLMMDQVVAEINKRRSANVAPLPKFSQAAIDLNRQSSDRYSTFYEQCRECERYVRDYYLEDVSMFGYQFPYQVR